MSPMDLQLPPTPPMDLSDSNSNSSNDYKVSSVPQLKKTCSIESHLKMRISASPQRHF